MLIQRTRVGRYVEAPRNKNLRAAMDASLARRDVGRQRRIALYTARAARGLPLFRYRR